MQFGYSDAGRSHDDLRRIWLAHGSPWFSKFQQPPTGWNPYVQLEASGHHIELYDLTFFGDAGNSTVLTIAQETIPMVAMGECA